MGCRCPVCGKTTETAMNLARHMTVSGRHFAKHIEWIESHGIFFPSILGVTGGKLGKGSYQELAQLLAKEACDN